MKQPVFTLKEAFAVFFLGTLLAVLAAEWMLGIVLSAFGQKLGALQREFIAELTGGKIQ